MQISKTNNNVTLVATVCFYQYRDYLEFVEGNVDLNKQAYNQNSLVVGVSVGVICGIVTVILVIGSYFNI